ncbi:hypothetical protein BH10ACT1_BH10ACT1_15580 [soil metagenome]
MIASLALTGVAVVACSSGGQGVREKALAAITSGTWDCGARKGRSTMRIEAGKDGSFEIRSLGKEAEEPAVGSWKVVDKKVSLSVATDDGKGILDVRGFDDLNAKAGTITVQDPEDTDRTASFEVQVQGTDTVAITPDDQSTEEFPSGTWSCEHR